MPLAPKSFQDIITFSRATGNATYYNSSGYLTTAGILNYLTQSNAPENAAWTKQDSFVQTNLLTYSEQFDNAAVWIPIVGTVANTTATTAPNGTLSAELFYPTATGGASRLYQSVTVTQPQVFSIYAKAAGVNFINFRVPNNAVAAFVYFDLVNGVVSSGTGTITSVGNGWYRCSAAVSSAGTAISFAPCDASGSTTVTASGTSGIYIWGAQLVQGAVPGNYQATTAAALPVLYADWTGALTARKICQNAAAAVPHGLRQILSGLTGSTTYTLSFYAKAGESTKANAWQFPGTTVFTITTAAVYDLVAGTATGDGSPTIQSVGNGWYRCTKTLTTVASPASGTIHIGPTDAAGNQNYNGDGTSGVYITDMQIELGTTVGPYYETTASQYNAPRFDYNPATLQPRGLLIEEQRANLLLQSNDFQTSWSLTNITRTLNSILSPSGNVDGVKIEATASAATALYQQANVAATSATFSVYAKQGTGATTANTFIIRNVTTLTNLIVGTLNYSTGVFTYTTGSTGVVVTPLANGWWRIAMSATAGITSGDLIAGYVGFVGGAATAGDFLYAYGAQLETGAFATAYIPTTISQVTRAADVVSVNTLSPWFNQAVGTFYAEFETIYTGALDVNRWLIGADNNTNKRLIYLSITSPYASTYDGSTVLNASTTDVTGGIAKAAMRYIPGVERVITSGGAVVNTGACTTNFAATSDINIGSISTLANSYLCGWMRRVTYYPRTLTYAELQAITT